jgi:peptidoglycan/xylan/chitin deacetylase (PgdA/CDA1 family)
VEEAQGSNGASLRQVYDRRRLLLLLAAGTAGALAVGGSVDDDRRPRPATATKERLRIPPPHPGRPRLVHEAPKANNSLVLTVDDGYSKATVAAYVEFARATGIHLSFSPNGQYSAEWEPHAPVLRPLIRAGQVQIVNHTFHHANLLRLRPDQLRREIQQNEDWIIRTFGVTSRPWFRPPYGYRNSSTDDAAGALGFTRILLWNGDLGDAFPISPAALMQHARQYMRPGTILLGHANHTTVTKAYDQLVGLIRERRLRPATLDEVFGTSRATG